MKEKTLSHLLLDKPLSGALDLSFLDELGYRKISSITFHEGYITEITNIPKSVRNFVCKNNLLTTIHIPGNLVHMDVFGNRLRSITSEESSPLKELNIGNNLFDCADITPQLKHFTLLELLNITLTDITKVDLLPLESLKTLYCSNHVSIMHVHEGVTVNPVVLSPESEIMNRLSQYFEYKNTQGTKLMKRLHEISKQYKSRTLIQIKAQEYRETKQLCFACRQPGKGSIFDCKTVPNKANTFTSSTIYTATCGALGTQCKLNIEIHCGNCVEKHEYFSRSKRELQDSEQSIIYQALQSKYELVMPDETVARLKLSEGPQSASSFKRKEEHFRVSEDLYKRMLHPVDAETLKNQLERTNILKGELHLKLGEYEYTESSTSVNNTNMNIIREAHHLRRELMLENQSLRDMKYPFYEIDTIYDTGGNKQTSVLIKSLYKPDNMTTILKPMKMVHWTIV